MLNPSCFSIVFVKSGCLPRQARRNATGNLNQKGACVCLITHAMLCYAMLCYAMLCYAMLCYAMLCYAMLCYAM
eukprot:COSAG06_NODE_9120_length_1981_cov_3.900106_2_plen_73_part_01